MTSSWFFFSTDISFYVAEESRVKQTDLPRVGFKLPVETLQSYETVQGNTAASRGWGWGWGWGWGKEKTKDYNSVALGLHRSVRTL